VGIEYDDDDTGADIVGYSDPDEDALLRDEPSVKPGSLLAQIAKAASAYVAKPTRLEVPTVPGLFAEYSTALETRQLDRLRRAAERYPEKPLRTFRFNLLLLAHYNTGFWVNGEQMLDGSGDPATFRSRELWEQFGGAVGDAASAVYEMYGKSDFAVVQAANALMSDAGIDADPAREAGDRPDPS